MQVFDRSTVPMLMVDDDRRYAEANPPARSFLTVNLEELRQFRLDDFVPPHLHELLEANWDRMLETGSVTSNDAARPRHFLDITWHLIAHVLRGRHVIAFIPPGWPTEQALDRDGAEPKLKPISRLTPREREILELAADGLNGPRIAQSLVLSEATVKTHFGHIYHKLGVTDRSGAVAKAMRLGLIR